MRSESRDERRKGKRSVALLHVFTEGDVVSTLNLLATWRATEGQYCESPDELIPVTQANLGKLPVDGDVPLA